MASRACSLENCGRRHHGRGFCKMHYLRFWKYGDPEFTLKTPDGAPLDWIKNLISTGDRSECWIWPFSTTSAGYGSLNYKGRTVGAHILSKTFDGDPIPDGLWALHHCDNPGCVNPDHIYAGTHMDNTNDMVGRERTARGMENGSSKLTDSQVLEAYGTNESARSVAERFGVSPSAIYAIRRGKRWSWLTNHGNNP